MRMWMARWAWIAAVLPLAGCNLLPDAYSGCNEPQPYQAAVAGPPPPTASAPPEAPSTPANAVRMRRTFACAPQRA